MRTLSIGQSVWARNFRDGARWVKAMVSDRLGPISYLVQLRNGDFWHRHIDHLRRGSEQPPQDDSAAEEEFIVLPESQTESGGPPAADTETPPGGVSSQASPEAPSQTSGPETAPDPQENTAGSPTAHLYPSRSRKPPDRLYGTLPLWGRGTLRLRGKGMWCIAMYSTSVSVCTCMVISRHDVTMM